MHVYYFECILESGNCKKSYFNVIFISGIKLTDNNITKTINRVQLLLSIIYIFVRVLDVYLLLFVYCMCELDCQYDRAKNKRQQFNTLSSKKCSNLKELMGLYMDAFVFYLHKLHRARAPYRAQVSLKSVTSYRFPTRHIVHACPFHSLSTPKTRTYCDKNQTTKSF